MRNHEPSSGNNWNASVNMVVDQVRHRIENHVLRANSAKRIHKKKVPAIRLTNQDRMI
jgi:hypothetical protein